MMELAVAPRVRDKRQHVLDTVRDMYVGGELCDVALLVGRVTLHCHRLMLAASSPYFRAMFCSGMSEANKSEIELQGLDAAILPTVVDYIYTHELEITDDNVQVLFSAAHLLQLDELLTSCAKYMGDNLDVNNCVNVYQFAEMHDSCDLFQRARSFILEHFKNVHSSEAFMSLNHLELVDILSDDNINIKDESVVFETATSWLQADIGNRKQFCGEVLKTIRFQLIEQDIRNDIFASLEYFHNGALISQCVQAMESSPDLNENKSDMDSTDVAKDIKRIGMHEKEMLVFAGGSESRHTRSLACYDPETRRNYYAIKPYVTFDYKYRIDQHTLTITADNYMYLIGGIFFDDHLNGVGQALSEVRCFDPFQRHWITQAPLKQGRCAHTAVELNSSIYVIGGQSTYPSGEPLSTVEEYCTERDTWMSSAPLPYGVSHHASAVVQGHIYVIGGYVIDISAFVVIPNNRVTNVVFKWDPKKDSTWTRLEAHMFIPRAESAFTVLNDEIYVIGGDNGRQKIAQTEVFNPVTEHWRFGPDFPQDRKSMSAVTLKGQIFVCGGTRTVISRYNRTPRVVESRDLWKLCTGDSDTGLSSTLCSLRSSSEPSAWVREAKLVQYTNSYGCAVGSLNIRRLHESEFVSQP